MNTEPRAHKAPFAKLHEIAKAADAVMRLEYPCKCYQPGCAHERLMKLLGWWKPKEAKPHA